MNSNLQNLTDSSYACVALCAAQFKFANPG